MVVPLLAALGTPQHASLTQPECTPAAADNTVHRNLGVACNVLGFTQLSALVLRPKKGHKYRLGWELWHHWVGRTVSGSGCWAIVLLWRLE